MSAARVTFVQKAEAAWSGAPPPEVVALAEYADARSGAAAATAIGYSASLVSTVLTNRYPGDLPAVFARIRGAMMGETVDCEVWGRLGRDRCLIEQGLPFSPTNSARAQCFRACRSGCPHSRLKGA